MRMITSLVVPVVLLASFAAQAAGGAHHPKQMEWSFDGVFGRVDKQSAQRGFQVYKEVCAACHGLKRVAFRQMTDLGFSEAEVKSLAATYSVQDGPNDMGEMFERPGRASDKFPRPHANDNAARAANNGALPPDLSLMAKARHDGPNYIYSLLTGYSPTPAYRCAEVTDGKCTKFDSITGEEAAAEPEVSTESGAPANVGQIFYCSDVTHKEEKDKDGKLVKSDECREMGVGMHYNPYFDGKQISMALPLHEDGVTFQDETKATIDQQAHDLVNFLQWAASPEMETRKSMGIHVILFLGAMTCFFYLVKKRIWANLH